MHDNPRLDGRGDALIGKRNVYAGRILAREREMIEPNRRVDFKRLPTFGSGFHGSLHSGLKVQNILFRELSRLAIDLNSGGSILSHNDEFFAKRLIRVR